MPKKGGLGQTLKNAKKAERKNRPLFNRHSEQQNAVDREDRDATEELVQGMVERPSHLFPQVADPKDRTQDDMFWNQQLSMRINRIQEAHENAKKVIIIDTKIKPQLHQDNKMWFELSKKLPIPKRPEWDRAMSAKQLKEKETTEFYEWRKALAAIEEDEKVILTPFEKNLEVWRQLWRVVERSDLVFIILDSRNPLMFRNSDLEAYINSHKNRKGQAKQFVLLLNKADLLTYRQREAWAKYFKRHDIRFIFFSANNELERQEEERQRELRELMAEFAEIQDEALEADLGAGLASEDKPEEPKKPKKEKPKKPLVSLGPDGWPTTLSHIFTKEEIIKCMEQYASLLGCPRPEDIPEPEPEPEPEENFHAMKYVRGKAKPKNKEVAPPVKTGIVVGMVGYPNVGKSSTINALHGSKKVNMSATPGKTKHFQTLILNPMVTLCDCPGLVFPSFSSTKEGMILDGITGIDIMRDAIGPMDLLLARIKKEVLEMLYSVDLEWENDEDDSPSFSYLTLNLYARLKGYMTDHNKPNQTRAARIILKDYVDGKLLYVHPPPIDDDCAPDEEGVDEEDPDEEYTTEEEIEGGDEDDEDTEDEGRPKKTKFKRERMADFEGEDLSDEEWDEEGEEDEEDEDFEMPRMHPEEPKIPQRDSDFNEHNVNMDAIYTHILQKRMLRKTKSKGRERYMGGNTEDEEYQAEVNDDGTHVLEIDDDDGIEMIMTDDNPNTEPKKTRRQERMEAKAALKGTQKGQKNQKVMVGGYE